MLIPSKRQFLITHVLTVSILLALLSLFLSHNDFIHKYLSKMLNVTAK